MNLSVSTEILYSVTGFGVGVLVGGAETDRRSGVAQFAILGVLHQSNNLNDEFRMIRSHWRVEAHAHGIGSVGQGARKRLIDDGHFGRSRSIALVKITAGQKRSFEGPEITRAHPTLIHCFF